MEFIKVLIHNKYKFQYTIEVDIEIVEKVQKFIDKLEDDNVHDSYLCNH